MILSFLFFLIIETKPLENNIADESSPVTVPPSSIPPTPAGHPPSPLIVWITCIAGVAVIGATVLVLCIKKQPDDMLFDASKEHLNTIISINDNNNINAPLMFTPEGSLN